MWEFYLDYSYYDTWAVRKSDDRDFNSDRLFHLMHKQDALNLCCLLNDLEFGKLTSNE